MTRCRCAECGCWLAVVPVPAPGSPDVIEVHPCGACLQEAMADGYDAAEAGLIEKLAERNELQQEGRD